MAGADKKGPLVAALDAEVFVREQYDFVRSRRLKDLVERVEQGHLKVFVTDITDREVRDGIRKRITDAVAALNQQDFRNRTRILQNTAAFTSLRPRPNRAALVAEVTSQWEDFRQRARVAAINTRDVTFGPIMDAYFAEAAPFAGSQQKKNEFPDAVFVAGCGAWAEKNEELVVVSGDAGVIAACSGYPRLISVAHVEDVLGLVILRIASRNLVMRAEAHLEALRQHIIDDIEGQFLNLEFAVTDDEFVEANVRAITIEGIRLARSALADVTDDTARFDVTANVEFMAEVGFDDPDTTVFVEGDRYVFGRVNGETTDVAEVDAAVVIELADDAEPDPATIDVQLDALRVIEVTMENFVQTTETMNDD